MNNNEMNDMAGKSFLVCSKCGATIESCKARGAGWLVKSNVRKRGEMVIRCPRHITRYAERQTYFTEREIAEIEDQTRPETDAYYRLY